MKTKPKIHKVTFKKIRDDFDESESRRNAMFEKITHNLKKGHYYVNNAITVYPELIDFKPTGRWIPTGINGVSISFTKKYLDAHPEMFQWVKPQ